MKRCMWIMAAVVLTAVGGKVMADSQSIDFEGYSVGKITNGTNGWQITNPNWDQAVTSVNPISGSKSWRISNNPGSGSYGDQPYTPALNDKVGDGQTFNYFSATMQFKGLANGKLGEGITVSLDNGTGQRGNYMRIENTGSNNWDLYVYDYKLNDPTNADANANFFSTDLTPGGLAADTVHTLGFTMAFAPNPANDVWKVYLDSNLAYTGTGWDQYYAAAYTDSVAGNFGPSPVVYDRLLYRAGGNQTTGAVGVMFDNISYSSAVVPLPSAAWMGIALLGALGVGTMLRSRLSLATA